MAYIIRRKPYGEVVATCEHFRKAEQVREMFEEYDYEHGEENEYYINEVMVE